MKPTENSWNLFGIDLKAVFTRYANAWAEVFWLQGSWGRKSIDFPVQVWSKDHTPDEEDSLGQLLAWQLDDEYVLFRELRLPVQMASASIHGIVTEEVNVSSPFDKNDTVAGWKVINKTNQYVDVVVAISSRQLIARVFSDLPKLIRENREKFEVWARFDDDFIVIEGFAEKIRNRRYKRRLTVMAGALILSVGLLLLAAVIPVVQKKLELDYLLEAHAQAKEQARTAVRLRTQLAQKNTQMEELNILSKRSVEPLSSLAILTRNIPVSGWLLSFEQRDNQIEIQGVAENAAALMQDLSSIELFEEVKPTSAIRKTGNKTKERYQLEIYLQSPLEGDDRAQ